MIKPPKVLVTGASGFIGSRIVRQLVDAGAHVKALVRGSSSRQALAGLPTDRVEVVEGDVMVGHTVFRALAGCDRMFHCAALTKVWDRQKGAIEQAAVVGTSETLEATRRRRIARVVYTSSAATLGVSDGTEPMDESHSFNLPEPWEYADGKRKAEEIALAYAKDFELVAVLPTNVYGPGDWKPTANGATVLRYLGWNAPLVDFPTIDGGTNVVDVDDVAQGHLLAMEKGRSGERYVLGGENVTFEELIDLLAEITGLPGPGPKLGQGAAELFGRLSELRARLGGDPPEISYALARDYVGKYTYVTSAKAEKELGYTHRSARRALARSVQWYLEHGYVHPKVARRIRVDLRAPA